MGNSNYAPYSHLHILLFLIYLPLLNIFGQTWQVEEKFIAAATINLHTLPEEESTVTYSYNYLDKVLVLVQKESPEKFGWSRIIYPNTGYVRNDDLMTFSQYQTRISATQSTDYTRAYWKPKTFECNQEYIFVKKDPSLTSVNAGIIKEDENILSIYDNLNEKNLWIKVLYPVEGYIESHKLLSEPSYSILSIGGYYGIVHQPYEENFDNYSNPLGAFLSYTKTDWDFTFRIGYNHSESNLAEYHLKTGEIYLNVHYTFLRLFDKFLSVYALAGGNYWNSKFQFTKYPTMTTYFPEEKDNGFGYKIGAGLSLGYSNFFIDLQYIFWSSKEAVFGEKPKTGEFKNQYVLYPGSNQFGVNFGYRFVFN